MPPGRQGSPPKLTWAGAGGRRSRHSTTPIRTTPLQPAKQCAGARCAPFVRVGEGASSGGGNSGLGPALDPSKRPGDQGTKAGGAGTKREFLRRELKPPPPTPRLEAAPRHTVLISTRWGTPLGHSPGRSKTLHCDHQSCRVLPGARLTLAVPPTCVLTDALHPVRAVVAPTRRRCPWEDATGSKG